MREKGRLVWIDWMKVIGIYLIIAGHLFPKYHEYVYVFSVPLFFVISGYLSKKEDGSMIFWDKTVHRLLVPSFILLIPLLVKYIIFALKHGDLIEQILVNCLSFIWGDQSILGTLWFVYSLIIIKVIFQYCNGYIFVLVNVICVICCVLLNQNGISNNNAVEDVCVSLPFFSIGYLFKILEKDYMFVYDKLILVLTIAIGIGIIVVIGHLNGLPWMYKNQYGNDFGLFFIGGISGTILIFCISNLLDKITSKHLINLSNGTLVILAIHPLIILGYEFFFGAVFSLMGYVIAIFILLAFIPILWFCRRFIPLLKV